MTTYTIVRSWPAMLLAMFFASVTAVVLLEDVLAGGQLRISHLTSLAALVAAFAAVHYAWPALRSRAVVSGAILALIGAAASGFVLITAGMRNSEQAAGKVVSAAAAREAREAAESVWRRLDGELTAVGPARSTQAVRAAMDAIVGKGEGRVPLGLYTLTMQCTDITRPASQEGCRPLLDLRVEMAAAIRRAELEPRVVAARARLDAMQPVAEAQTGYVRAARLLVGIVGLFRAPPGVDAVAEQLALLLPFLAIAIGEASTLGFGVLALGHARRTLPAAIPAALPAPVRECTIPEAPVSGNSARPNSRKSRQSRKPAALIPGLPGPGRKSDATVTAWVASFRERSGRSPSGSEVMAQFPDLKRSTAYDYARRL